MSTIITQPGRSAHPDQHPDAAARQRRDRLARATAEDEEPIPVCRECGAPVAIFLNRGLLWQHFRGEGVTSGTQEIYDPGHPAEVGWLLPGEDPEEL